MMFGPHAPAGGEPIGAARRPRRRLLLAGVTLLVTLLASLWTLPVTAQPTPPAQRPATVPTLPMSAATPPISIVVRAGAIAAPPTVPTGPVAVTFENATAGPLFASILRLNPGVTIAEVFAAYEAEDLAAFGRAATVLGGPVGTAVGERQTIVFDFAAGEYTIVAFDQETEVPLVATLRAMPPTATVAPSPVGVIELGEFFFRLPTVVAGTATYQVTNIGEQLHELVIARLAAGVTLAQVFAAEAMGTDPLEAGLVTLVPGVSEISPGQTAWPTLSFTPGTYVLLCFLPDPATGQEHVALGMVAEVTVP